MTGLDNQERYTVPMVGIGLIGAGHALATWPLQDALALFVGGALVVFSAEIIGVAVGLLDHRLEPQLLGVPVVILLGWPGLVYSTLRLVQLVVGAGPLAAVIAAGLATALDVVLDPIGVRDGAWHYPASADSGRRYRGVPYWNFLAWFVISGVTALLPQLVA